MHQLKKKLLLLSFLQLLSFFLTARNLYCITFRYNMYSFLNLFLFGCFGSSLLPAGFLQVWWAEATYSSLWCMGFSWWLLSLQSTGSARAGFGSHGHRAPEHRLSSCGTQAQLFCSMWDLPRPQGSYLCLLHWHVDS